MDEFYGRRSRRRGHSGFAKFEDFGMDQPGPGLEEGPGPGFEAGPGFGAGHGHGHTHGHDHWHGGPPPWRGGRRARRGDIRWALLVALLDGPSHGYELITRLESRTGGMWRPSAGSVYPTLQLLEDEGLVRGREAEGKRVFELTDEGRRAATAASERFGRVPWGGGAPAGQHGELRQAMKTLILAARQVLAAGDDEQVAGATGVLTEARQRLYRILAGEDMAGPSTPSSPSSPSTPSGPSTPPGSGRES